MTELPQVGGLQPALAGAVEQVGYFPGHATRAEGRLQ